MKECLVYCAHESFIRLGNTSSSTIVHVARCEISGGCSKCPFIVNRTQLWISQNRRFRWLQWSDNGLWNNFEYNPLGSFHAWLNPSGCWIAAHRHQMAGGHFTNRFPQNSETAILPPLSQERRIVYSHLIPTFMPVWWIPSGGLYPPYENGIPQWIL